MDPQTFLVLGATGQTGQHFTSLALADGHRVRVLARTPGKLRATGDHLEIHRGTITDPPDLQGLLAGVDAVVSMLGDIELQRTTGSTPPSSAGSSRRCGAPASPGSSTRQVG